MEPKELQDKITKNLEKAVKEIAQLKKKFDGEIPCQVRRFRRSKKKASHKICNTNLPPSQKQISTLIKKIEDAEIKESRFYQSKAEEEERRVWERMKDSSKYFFKFARAKVRIKTPIGLLVSKKGDIIQDAEAETLNREYQTVFE